MVEEAMEMIFCTAASSGDSANSNSIVSRADNLYWKALQCAKQVTVFVAVQGWPTRQVCRALPILTSAKHDCSVF